MNLFIQIDVRIAILPRLSRPRWYIIVIFCGNLRNMPSRNTGKNNKNILWLLGSQILGNKTNCDQMTQKSPAYSAPIVGVFSARWLAGVWPGHTPAPGPRADINGGCLQWSQHHGRTSRLQTMPMGGVAYKDSLD